MRPMRLTYDRQRIFKLLKTYAPKFGLLFGSLLLTFLPMEIYLRHRYKAWPFEEKMLTFAYMKREEVALRWRYSPGEGRNSLGLLGPEIGPKKPGTLRIVFLGDSLVFAAETSSKTLYTEVIGLNLNERLGRPGRRFEVINAGIPGYTTYQELEFLRLHGLKMEPDLVILGFVFNDVYYKYLHKPTRRGLLDMEPTLRLERFDPNVFPGCLFARSYLAHKLFFECETAWHRVWRRPVFPFERRDDFFLAWKEHGWKRMPGLISEMKGLLGDRGIPMLAVVFPVSDQVNSTYRRMDERYVLFPERKIEAILKAADVPFLNLTDPLYRNGGQDLYVDYLHLGPKGNDIVAREVTRFLIERQSDWITEP